MLAALMPRSASRPPTFASRSNLGVLLAVLGTLAAPCACAVSPGTPPLWCGDADVIPAALSFSGSAPTRVAGVRATNYFAVSRSAFYTRGKGLLNIERAGALAAVCVSAVDEVPTRPPAAAAFVFSIASPFDADSSGCLLVSITSTDGDRQWPPLPTARVNISYWLRSVFHLSYTSRFASIVSLLHRPRPPTPHPL